MTQDQQQKKAAGRDPNREHMTLSELWQLGRDNLMSLSLIHISETTRPY